MKRIVIDRGPQGVIVETCGEIVQGACLADVLPLVEGIERAHAEAAERAASPSIGTQRPIATGVAGLTSDRK